MESDNLATLHELAHFTSLNVLEHGTIHLFVGAPWKELESNFCLGCSFMWRAVLDESVRRGRQEKMKRKRKGWKGGALGGFIDGLVAARPLHPLDDDKNDGGHDGEHEQTTGHRQTDDDGQLPLGIVVIACASLQQR